MICQYCNQPISISKNGFVHEGGWTWCADLKNRASMVRGPQLVRHQMGLAEHIPAKLYVKHIVGWATFLGTILFLRLWSMGVGR